MKRVCSVLLTLVVAILLSQGTGNAAAPEVRPSADIRNSGEITGVIIFCGAAGPNGTHVDLIGESSSVIVGTSGSFALRFVPQGAYTLRVQIPNQPQFSQSVQVSKGQVTDVGPIERCEDNDADGFDPDPAVGNDCNDNNPQINPSAIEICDGLDNDCDGVVDGVACQVCTDGDNDGFFAQGGCGTPIDCNDANDTIRPNATEICDATDNNCDSSVDEGFNLSDDPVNCGTCGNVCISGQCGGGICLLECGNGILEDGEACDDGNNVDGDGCQANCTFPFCTIDADCALCEICTAGACEAAEAGSDPKDDCVAPSVCDGAGACEAPSNVVFDLDWFFGVSEDEASATINVGDTVSWTWTDNLSHSVRTTSGVEVFDSGIQSGAGSQFSHAFNNVGTTNYECEIHPSEIGTITVIP